MPVDCLTFAVGGIKVREVYMDIGVKSENPFRVSKTIHELLALTGVMQRKWYSL